MSTKKILIAIVTIVLIVIFYRCGRYYAENNTPGLKDYYSSYFNMGVIVSSQNIWAPQVALLLKEFNSITLENAMKMQSIHPIENQYCWVLANTLVNFIVKKDLKIRGHTLCWYEQVLKIFPCSSIEPAAEESLV